MAKRRRTSAKQRVASKRNLVKARRKRLAIAGGAIAAGAVLGGAITARHVYNKQFVTLYHATSHGRAARIVKTQRMGSQSVEKGNLFFFVGKGNHDYGHSIVKVKMRKSHFKKVAMPDDGEWLPGAVKVHGSHINNKYRIQMGHRNSKKVTRNTPRFKNGSGRKTTKVLF